MSNCQIPIRKEGYYIHENDELSAYKVDQTIITKKELLHLLPYTDYEEQPAVLPIIEDWYPFVNSYYPYTEDVDAFARVNHLLTNKPSTFAFDTSYLKDETFFSEKLAQLQYLQAKPVSFIILGKPGIGEQDLAKQLADHWNCVYIDPEILIQEEIESSTRAGECIEFNLRCGRAIGIDVILRLLEKRIKSQSALHRGFVICGLPVIPNDLYEEDPVSSESAVFNVREIFEEILDQTINIAVPPSKLHVSISSKAKIDIDEPIYEEEVEELVSLPGEEEPPLEMPSVLKSPLPNLTDVGSTVDNICTAPDISTNYEQQLDFLFSLMQSPFLIIYIACSGADVINKRKDYRHDIYSNQNIDLQRERATKTVYSLFESGVASDALDELLDANYFDVDSSRLNHLVLLPRNFPVTVAAQLERFHIFATKVIEHRVLIHDPQYYIKLDGRTNPRRMFNVLKSRLRILPLQKVLEPTRLNTNEEIGGEDEQQEESNLQNLSLEECFHALSGRKVPSSSFKWRWSDWGAKCPVSMKNGLYVNGDPNFAVHFMNKLFFLANEEAYIKFYRNPRPYLLPPYPKPSSKIFVFGPKRCGKTAVSEALGYLLNSTVLHPVRMLDDYLKSMRDSVIDKLKQQALTEALQILNNKRLEESTELEANRQRDISSWMDESKLNLQTFVSILENEEEKADDDLDIISSFPMPIKKSVVDFGLDGDLKEDPVKLYLHEQGIPIDQSLSFYKDILANQLSNYLPDKLKTPPTPLPATVFDQFVIDYVENAVTNIDFDNVSISTSDIIQMFATVLKEVEDSGADGWIMDPMLCNEELLASLYPEYMADEVILLKDTSSDYQFLLEQFDCFDWTNFKDFRNLFTSINRHEAAWRSPSIISTQSYKTKMAISILDEILYGNNFSIENISSKEDVTAPKTYLLSQYKQDLLNYEEQFIKVREFFEKNNIKITEVDVTGKSMPDLILDVINTLEEKYRLGAAVFTEEDRAEEVKNLGAQTLLDEEEGEDGDQTVNDTNRFEENRRYGDTYFYCPVTYKENWLLWKGKEEFAAKFEDKVYLLSSDEALQKFLANPRDYLPTIPYKFAPPRICIVGFSLDSQIQICKALCKNIGAKTVNYESDLKSLLELTYDGTFEDLRKDPEYVNTAIWKYLNDGESIGEEILDSVIGKYWLQNKTCYVIDGFPKRPSDLTYMIAHKRIPDIILEIVTDKQVLHDRMLAKFLAEWHKENNLKQILLQEKRDELTADWQENRDKRLQELIIQNRDSRYAEKIKQVIPEEDEDLADDASQISYNSIAEQEDFDNANAKLEEEIPPIVFDEEQLETIEEATEKFEASIEEFFQVEDRSINDMKTACHLEEIVWSEIKDHDNVEKSIVEAFYATSLIKFRSNSLFERCYEVSNELAERLLNCGYFFLSKFGKTCPVQFYEKLNPIQMYLPMEAKYGVHPVIHRQYIYFLIGQVSLLKFKTDPFKYICIQNFSFPLLPFRIAVSGPPKCGKSTLAEEFKNNFGMKVVSRGSAARYVLNYLPECELAKKMENVLRRGWELTDEMIMHCVEAYCYDSRVVTQGVVFDGFPNTIYEVRHLSYLGMVPNVVVDLQASKEDTFLCLEQETVRKNIPRYSQHFIAYVLDQWNTYAKSFREWFDREYQIIYKIPITTSNWSVRKQAFDLMLAVAFEIRHYFKHIKEDWPLRLSYMLVTPLEFLERQSSMKHYCPCCLHFEKELQSGGDPPDRTGLVQFRYYFYWLCNNHIEHFLKDPEQFISPYNQNSLPEFLPLIVRLKEMPTNLYENGICIVCYLDTRHIQKGVLENAISFRNKTYLFDKRDCLQAFLKNPYHYARNVKIVDCGVGTSLNYSELPILGFLEQYVSEQLVSALNETVKNRPIIPGLSIVTSIAIGIGLNLKVSNENLPNEYHQEYIEALRIYDERRLKLIRYLKNMKSVINPYLNYEECMPKFAIPKTPTEVSVSSENTDKTMYKIVSEILDDIDYDDYSF